MNKATNKQPKLTPFTIAIPDSQTMLQGHMNPLKLPISYVMDTMSKIGKLPAKTIVKFMQNN